MKIINHIIRFLVGGLFIFSGLIKLNDPVGTEIKLEEYFEVFALDESLGLSALAGFWEFLVPYSLTIAVALSVIEVVLGLNLLILHRVRSTLWFLFLTIVFFSFLTFYSAYFNKVTDCGCFGDAIKLTPWQSFSKDVILFVLISILFFQKQPLGPNRSTWPTFILSTATTIASFALAYYAISHLPPLDFRPYKIGANIEEQMQASEELKYGDAVYIYTNLETGEDEEYSDQEYNGEEKWKILSDTNKYRYKDFSKPLLNPEAQAKITDFKVVNAKEEDYTDSTFVGEKLLIITPDIRYIDPQVLPRLDSLARQLEEKKIQTWVLTADTYQDYEAFRMQYQFSVPYFSADKTVLKTMVRSNPGLLHLKEGTVMNKWHYNDLPQAQDFP